VGNVVGSNVFNLLAVLGAAAIAGGGIEVPAAAVATDLPVALLVAAVALPALASGLRVTPWEGALLLVGYVGYVGYLVLDGTDAQGADTARIALFAGLGAIGVVLVAVGLAVRSRR
jgi:cation:H+ antiporter